MKTLLTILVLFAFLSLGWSQPIFEENFDYPENTDLTNYGWAAHSGAGNNPIQVVSPGLSYSGYPPSGVGNAVSLISTTSSAEDVDQNFTEQTSGSVYAAFMVNVSTAGVSGTYFFHLGPTSLGTTFRGKVYAQDDGSGNLQFGVSKSSNSDALYTAGNYLYNTTYLVVLKYTFNSGSADDEASLWINPNLSGNEPPPDLIQTDSGSDAANLGSVALRQGYDGAELVLDGIRIATSWQELSGGVVHPPLISNLLMEPFPANAPIQVTADVTISSGSVDSVKFYYYTDMNPATVDSMDMNLVSGDQYGATISGLGNGTSLDYWVKAWGNGLSSISTQAKVVVGIPDIGTFHQQLDPDGLPLNLNYLARLRGIVTVSTGVFSTSNYDFYIQDNTGGIDVFQFSLGTPGYTKGDSLEVVGTISHYNGKVEIMNFTATVLSSGNPLPSPLDINLEDMGEEYEGRLLSVDNVSPAASSGPWITSPPDTSFNMIITDNTGELTMRIIGSTDIGGISEPNWPITVVGIGGQFDVSAPYFEEYQLMPRSSADLAVTGIPQEKAVPLTYRLDQNYPNPFNPKTTIRYQLARSGEVQFRVFNITGQEVFSVNKRQEAGSHEISFDGRRLASGIYFYQLKAGEFQSVRKMILSK